MVQAPCSSSITYSRLTQRPYLGSFWISPRIKTPQSLRATSASASSPSLVHLFKHFQLYFSLCLLPPILALDRTSLCPLCALSSDIYRHWQDPSPQQSPPGWTVPAPSASPHTRATPVPLIIVVSLYWDISNISLRLSKWGLRTGHNIADAFTLTYLWLVTHRSAVVTSLQKSLQTKCHSTVPNPFFFFNIIHQLI